jgi:hypothetical protein
MMIDERMSGQLAQLCKKGILLVRITWMISVWEKSIRRSSRYGAASFTQTSHRLVSGRSLLAFWGKTVRERPNAPKRTEPKYHWVSPKAPRLHRLHPLDAIAGTNRSSSVVLPMPERPAIPNIFLRAPQNLNQILQ